MSDCPLHTGTAGTISADSWPGSFCSCLVHTNGSVWSAPCGHACPRSQCDSEGPGTGSGGGWKWPPALALTVGRPCWLLLENFQQVRTKPKARVWHTGRGPVLSSVASLAHFLTCDMERKALPSRNIERCSLCCGGLNISALCAHCGRRQPQPKLRDRHTLAVTLVSQPPASLGGNSRAFSWLPAKAWRITKPLPRFPYRWLESQGTLWAMPGSW